MSLIFAARLGLAQQKRLGGKLRQGRDTGVTLVLFFFSPDELEFEGNLSCIYGFMYLYSTAPTAARS
jgi:hypothetical protein